MTHLEHWIYALALAASLGCALIAGVFFAFSSFVMRALIALPAPVAIAAMQAINVTVLRSWFLVVFFATALLSLLALIVSLPAWRDPATAWVTFGSILYLGGSFLVTVVCNVPRNQALAAVSAGGPESASIWSVYAVRWTQWNHVRTVASLAAAVLFGMAFA